MIWFKNYTLEDLAIINLKRNLTNLLEIQVAEIGPDFINVTMPVLERTHQIYGILHGGATCVLVESAGSIASGLCIDPENQYAVGSQIHVNHLRPIRSGLIIAKCTPVHLGKLKHVWDVPVYAVETGKLIAKGELTCAIVGGKFGEQS